MQLLAVLVLPAFVMSGLTDRGDKNSGTSRALWHKRGLNKRLTKFPVAHVSFVGDPVSVAQYNAQLFQQTSMFPGILWFWCPRRLDETVGCANVWNCVTLWSVSSRTCQVTTSFRLHGQLNYDLCTPAVNLMFSLAVYAMRSPSCSPPARSYQFCLERITSLVAAEAGPLLPLSIDV